MREAYREALQKDFFTEFSLMSIASIGAFSIGEYPEAVAVMLFYTVGEMLQNKAVERASQNISRLLDVRPERTDRGKARRTHTARRNFAGNRSVVRHLRPNRRKHAPYSQERR